MFFVAFAIFISIFQVMAYVSNGVAEGIPGKRTLENFLKISIQPVGRTMYTWGGGWNVEDTGSGIGSTTIGLLPEWDAFRLKQDEHYDLCKDKSPITGGFKYINDGLDCSGLVGRNIYVTLNTESGREGYVMSSTKMASEFAKRGWGKFTEAKNIEKRHPGDIMSTRGHVFICLGECEDGSFVLLHSSPCGVHIAGTPAKSVNQDSDAIRLVKKYVEPHYQEWYTKYPKNYTSREFLTNYDQMTWYVNGEPGSILTDPDNVQNMNAKEVLKLLFGDK